MELPIGFERNLGKKNTFIYAFTSINKQPQDDFEHDFGPNLNV